MSGLPIPKGHSCLLMARSMYAKPGVYKASLLLCCSHNWLSPYPESIIIPSLAYGDMTISYPTAALYSFEAASTLMTQILRIPMATCRDGVLARRIDWKWEREGACGVAMMRAW
jgi:hypothetical protein